jgi:hypothetical protein
MQSEWRGVQTFVKAAPTSGCISGGKPWAVGFQGWLGFQGFAHLRPVQHCHVLPRLAQCVLERPLGHPCHQGTRCRVRCGAHLLCSRQGTGGQGLLFSRQGGCTPLGPRPLSSVVDSPRALVRCTGRKKGRGCWRGAAAAALLFSPPS